MTSNDTLQRIWRNEPDWLCAVEFWNDEDPEGQDFTTDIIGHRLGYAHLTNTRSLALVGDDSAVAYELLFSFSVPEEKSRFLAMIRLNDDLGRSYIENDLFPPTADEVHSAQPLAAVLPQRLLANATLVAASVCSSALLHVPGSHRRFVRRFGSA
jgi:hypothetical protein